MISSNLAFNPKVRTFPIIPWMEDEVKAVGKMEVPDFKPIDDFQEWRPKSARMGVKIPAKFLDWAFRERSVWAHEFGKALIVMTEEAYDNDKIPFFIGFGKVHEYRVLALVDKGDEGMPDCLPYDIADVLVAAHDWEIDEMEAYVYILRYVEALLPYYDKRILLRIKGRITGWMRSNRRMNFKDLDEKKLKEDLNLYL